MKILGVKGMNDILPDPLGPMSVWQRIEAACRARFDRYGYREVRTPIVEETRLFARSIGEETDIVGKEMYSFTDRKGKKQLSLRPEGTAGVVRSYIQHSVHSKNPITKWWYGGPMYRYERVQAGRYRQFHQIGAEALGVAAPAMDAEMLLMLDGLLRHDLGIQSLTLLINSLGDRADRASYVQALRDYLGSHLTGLCEDCKKRYERNPLRALDCKVPPCQPILDKAPRIKAHLSSEARTHFDTVLELLSGMQVPFEIKPRLVRGLDYYNRTCFEFVAGGLGAHDTVCAGGRYDDLVKTLGGPSIPAVGFALGMERLVLLAPKELSRRPEGPAVFFVSVDEEAISTCFRLTESLRRAGLEAEMDQRGGSVKSQMRRADKVHARFAVVIGEQETSEGAAHIKDLRAGEEVPVETPVSFEDLAAEIHLRLKRSS